MRTLLSVFFFVAAAGSMSWQLEAAAPVITERTTEVVAVRNLSVKDGVVSGDLANQSPRPVRDVELLIRYVWHWKNEFRPGKESPGMAVYHTVEGEIPPGESRRFVYTPPSPLPSRLDGTFETIVAVAGFSEVFR